ncbi:unnamed protein product [Miscanthus lutarioriparius]|uniref:BHLH domain-containing protein n=1 Tax=Miscanthus lutarioriparius TaxID=422564 RepID=A0A811RIV7_9POAL|nr:unnamed protein product [Miscanthus lutarioriparius]
MPQEHPLSLSLPPPAKGKEASPWATPTAEAERARRRHMSRLYAELGAQLPGPPPRVRPSVYVFYLSLSPLGSFVLGHGLTVSLSPRSSPRAQASMARILEDAIAYVGVLRATVAGLEERAAFARSPQTTAPAGAGAGAAEVLVAGKASCFAVRLPEARTRGALTRVLEVFRRHGVPVLAATVTSDGGEAAVTVTTAPVPPRFLQGIQEDIRSSTA